jgi:hypothetical protein
MPMHMKRRHFPLTMWLIALAAATAMAQEAPATSHGDEIETRWGIEIMSLRLSSAGYMIDFRYKVIDAEKAAPLFDRRVKPKLIDEASGMEMSVPTGPTTGQIRNSNPPRAGKVYFMFFANPGRQIKSGSKVTIAIGEFKTGTLAIE